MYTASDGEIRFVGPEKQPYPRDQEPLNPLHVQLDEVLK
jgi:hypothetical protein